jgi:hypothetical protein
MSMKLAVFAADIGAVQRGRFGWASDPACEKADHTSIRHMVDAVVGAANGGSRIALGVECPLFVPCPEDPSQLGKARTGEGRLAVFAQVGATVAVLGLQQLCWVLRGVRDALSGRPTGTVDWSEFESRNLELFLWEAFISGSGKSGSHVDDAAVAVRNFQRARLDAGVRQAVTCPNPVSLGGLALLWSGWSRDAKLLETSTWVIKA